VSGVSASRTDGGDPREVVFAGRGVVLTNLDKVLWPRTGFTKGAMIEYYERASGVLLPHIQGRPLTLGRFPDGIDGPGFAQTECRGRPEWMSTRPIRTRAGDLRRFCVVDDVASLLWVANQNAIELHAFLSGADDLDEPRAVAFDLDPGPGRGLLDSCRVALSLRDDLGDAGLASFPKTTGGRGLHLFVPIDAGHTYRETKSFAREVADRLAASHPDLVTSGTRRAERAGRIAIDWAQNSRMRTTVVPYSLRSADLPLVSTPLRWNEVEAVVRAGTAERLVVGPDEISDRVARHGDPFAPVLRLSQSLARP
jgi:bifunctional non-homologous end joining protein LigD